MRIAVTGTAGQVVQSLTDVGPRLGAEVIPVGRPHLDLLQPGTILPALRAAAPDVIVSAAAYTAVDKAETDRESAFAINATGAGAVAQAAAVLNVPILHLSTDYVYDGAKSSPYVETDPTGPISVYGNSKLEGEQLVAAATPNHVILRTAWVYSPFGNNFVKTMLRLAESRETLNVVADQHGCPTSALDIAEAIISIAHQLLGSDAAELRGVFHLSGQGEAVWADFAQEIFAGLKARGGKSVLVQRIPTIDYPTPAHRPANSRLSGKKLQQAYGILMPDWHISLNKVLNRLISGPKE